MGVSSPREAPERSSSGASPLQGQRHHLLEIQRLVFVAALEARQPTPGTRLGSPAAALLGVALGGELGDGGGSGAGVAL